VRRGLREAVGVVVENAAEGKGVLRIEAIEARSHCTLDTFSLPVVSRRCCSISGLRCGLRFPVTIV
jgi:hypothetical protein